MLLYTLVSNGNSLSFFSPLIFLNKEKINCNQIVNEIVSENSNQQEGRQEVWGQMYEIYGK